MLIDRIRASRLGACWYCMSFSVAMLALSAWGTLVAARASTLEQTGVLGSSWFALAMMVCAGAFTVLCLAHLICLILRMTVWIDPSE